jgi:hypothetical protein
VLSVVVVKVEGSVIIDRFVEDVWKFVTDLAKMPEWDTVLVEIRQTSPGPLGVGVTLESKRKDMAYLLRVAEYEPCRRLTLDYISGPLEGSRSTISTNGIGGRTKLSLMLDARTSRWYKWVYLLLTPLMIPIGNRENKALVGNAKRILESEAHR